MALAEAYTTRVMARLLGLSERGVQLRAKRENWDSRPRKGRGGGSEWLLNSMPEKTRLTVAKGLIAEQARHAEASRRDKPVNSLQKLPPARRDRAEARALVVQLARRFYTSAKLPRTSAYELFAAGYNRGEVLVADWVRETLPHLCRASLFNWENTFTAEGAAALAGKQGRHRKGCGAMGQLYVVEFCLAHIYRFPHLGANHIYKGLKARLELEERPERLPHQRRLQAWYKDWREKNEELFVLISNPDAWRNKFRESFGDMSGLVDRLNQEWEMDSTPCDLILSDGKRHSIVACLDVYCRRVIFHVSRTSTSHAVATCLRKAITAWGVPETVRTDNGAEYIGRHITRVLLDMEIYQDVCDPFTPQQKPFVERVFKSFLHDIIEVLVGYTGHNVSERKALEARRSFAQRVMTKDAKVELNVSPDELQQICDRWANDTYAHNKHSKLGMSPYEMALQYDGPIATASPEALRLLFLPCVDGDGLRHVSKKGIRFANDLYVAPELALYIDHDVQVRVDDADYGKIYVYNIDGTEYLCTARGVKHDGMTGAEVKAAAVFGRKLQNAQNSRGRKALATADKTMQVGDIAYERMLADEKNARRIETEHPMRALVMDIHSTPALEGAAQAAQAAEASYTPPPMTDAERQAQRQAKDALETALRDRLTTATTETAEQRFARAEQMLDLKARGGTLPQEDERWLNNYLRTPQYDAQKRLHEYFNSEAARAAL